MATLTTLVGFNSTDGQDPQSALIEDSAGDLFGTTYNGGTSNEGTLFEIVNTATGYATTPTILLNFNETTGDHPVGNLITDAAGDLFGTTSEYGPGGGYGTVFEIAKTATGYATTPTTLVTFNLTDGADPIAGLITDAAGDLFGTTGGAGAGPQSYGTVFEIAKTASGYSSTPTTLAAFNYFDGEAPSALIADASGDLFGTTKLGGANGDGTVFEIVKTPTGYASTPTTLVNFDGTNGASSVAGLVADAAGDLFGTTEDGGTNDEGTVFEIAKTATGYASSPTTLVNFNLTDGQAPSGGLLIDAAGDLFGTTLGGGANEGEGTVFEIAKTATGYASTPTILASFNGVNDAPAADLLANAAGDLFGTSTYGGVTPYDDGTVFEVTGSGFVTTSSPPANAFTIVDSTLGTTTTSAGQAYTGPVAGITSEFVTNTSDILNVTANVPNTFIEIAPPVGGAPPTLAGINVSAANGNNVLDAYGNSNFYTGGTGTDQFYEDARTLTQNSWSTIVNFHSGDNITIWGITAADFNLDWIGDTFGAPGATGLTGVLVPTTAGQPEVAVTLAGFKLADATDGKLSLSYGQTQSQNGVAGSTYLSIHAV